MLDPAVLRKRILDAIPDAEVEIVDTTGGGDHFKARVVSASFAGLPLVQQHQRVYAPLRDLLATGELHALSLETSATPKAPEGGSR